MWEARSGAGHIVWCELSGASGTIRRGGALDLTEIIVEIGKQGPLVGLLLWLLVDNRKRLDAKETTIESLHKEMRGMQEQFFDRLAVIKKDSESVLIAIKEAFKG